MTNAPERSIIPGEMVVDPWLFSIALAVHAKQNGATIFTQFEMDPAKSAMGEDGFWTIQRKQTDETNTKSMALRGKTVVNATGLWTDLVQADKPCHWTTQPRRGQYRIYSSNTLVTRPIQPVPSPQTKGIFVFSTLYDQLVVGPRALDQPSREDCSVNPSVSAALEQHLLRIVPQVDPLSYRGDYVGIRPGTEHCDYQISVSQKWIACASIRSTGLTASLGIGRYVTQLLEPLVGSSHSPDNSNHAIALSFPVGARLSSTPGWYGAN
ncbi:hypothetical protein FisN_2Lh123 [Fistulifera solaris]|uniref:FAD dependent oxidoreductase domain-containing protein n=1 Tax=Fistulifera solaris TaxID=1519565 RepID=A0A1Z5JX45_FISSO|nr:hypothetical protein FisN_2Lh123 [Fistulifera solaris]|eukprot:GAX18469.1 hypothetical protein FisN_2Lh123 [Fistulifera solaris]